MLREVEVPEVSGRLFLSRMPGRHGPFGQESQAINDHGVDIVISLTSLDEIASKAPEYGDAIRNEALSWERQEFPIDDYGVPADSKEFLNLARNVADYLQAGRRILIHCGAGIGRTGTLATCVLMASRIEYEDALNRVRQARSGPENEGQSRFVQAIGELLRQGDN